jgi:uncharacterized protein YcbX
MEPRPYLAQIRLHPIKSLDQVAVSEARIGPGGGLELDRVWALYSIDGQWVNGKRTAAIHAIRAGYSPGIRSVTLSVPGDRRNIPTRELAFPQDTAGASQWFSTYFEQPITVRYVPEGVPDDGLRSGPTIISTASLQRVAEWFPQIDLEESRQRFRAPLEINGVPAFWEDQLFSGDERRMVRFRIGNVNFEGSNPCPRCPVPARDTHTGADLIGFQKLFTALRRAELPSWAAIDRFEHFYQLGINTLVASTEYGKTLLVGDRLEM